MDTENVKLSLGQLQTRIQRVASAPINDQSELEKRKIWRDLELLKMAIDYQSKKISPEAHKDFEATYPELAKALTLKPHSKRSGGFKGAIRFGAFFFVTTIMFPVFILTFPLRWLHPLLRKLGVRNNRLPYDYIPRIWAKWSMLVFGIKAKIEGWENASKFAETGTSTIGLFQHSSFFDFIVVMGSCNLLFKWVSKKSLYKIPMIGQMGYMAGMIPIDRSNLDSAKRSLDHAAHVAQHYGRAIAIAPEGTRSVHGQLAEFKKGAFHLALKCKVDATPMVLFGAYTLWPPNTICPSPGEVTLRFLPPIKTDNYLPDKYNQMLVDVRTRMLDAMADAPKNIAGPTSTAYGVLSAATVVGTYALAAGISWGIWQLFHLN